MVAFYHPSTIYSLLLSGYGRFTSLIKIEPLNVCDYNFLQIIKFVGEAFLSTLPKSDFWGDYEIILNCFLESGIKHLHESNTTLELFESL